MEFKNRLERLSEPTKGNALVDFMYTRGVRGDSWCLWLALKDEAPLQISITGRIKLNEWIQNFYDKLPDECKYISSKNGRYLTCQSAAREGEPYAVMLCSLRRYLDCHPELVEEKLRSDQQSLINGPML